MSRRSRTPEAVLGLPMRWQAIGIERSDELFDGQEIYYIRATSFSVTEAAPGFRQRNLSTLSL